MDEERKISYVKILANPGFLKCTEPECETEQESVRASDVYAHAWDKHKTNYVFIENPQN